MSGRRLSHTLASLHATRYSSGRSVVVARRYLAISPDRSIGEQVATASIDERMLLCIGSSLSLSLSLSLSVSVLVDNKATLPPLLRQLRLVDETSPSLLNRVAISAFSSRSRSIYRTHLAASFVPPSLPPLVGCFVALGTTTTTTHHDRYYIPAAARPKSTRTTANFIVRVERAYSRGRRERQESETHSHQRDPYPAQRKATGLASY